MQLMRPASEDVTPPILDTFSLSTSPGAILSPLSGLWLNLQSGSRSSPWSKTSQIDLSGPVQFPPPFDVTSCPSLPPRRQRSSLLPSPLKRGARVPRRRPRPRPSRSKLLAALQSGRAAELRRARLFAEPGLAGTRLARRESKRSPRPASPTLPERQSRRNRDHKYAERRLSAAQPARRPPRLLSRRRRSPSRGRRSPNPNPSRERVHVPAATGRQHPGPARQDVGVAVRHATGPEAPQPPGPPGDGHRTHPSTCDQRHFPLPGPP